MRVVICDTAAAACARAVMLIAGQMRDKPESVIGLATGGTMELVYQGLIDEHRKGLSFAKITTFNLDEYVGLSPDHPQSYTQYMRQHLFDHVDLARANCFLPSGLDDPMEAASAYEELIAKHGPIDLQLLGLGHNGHIGFNEPSSALTSLTREKLLSQTTLLANERFFADNEPMPRSAITMGIGTICAANRIVLLALGSAKAAAVRSMVEGPVSAFCPASALQFHRRVIAILDAEAASDLALSDLYRESETLQAKRDNAEQPNRSGFTGGSTLIEKDTDPSE